jgi:hypothetical protein
MPEGGGVVQTPDTTTKKPTTTGSSSDGLQDSLQGSSSLVDPLTTPQVSGGNGAPNPSGPNPTWTGATAVTDVKDARRTDTGYFTQKSAQSGVETSRPMIGWLLRAGWSTKPQEVKDKVGGRFPSGPGVLSENERLTIVSLSSLGPDGVAWLHAAGLFTHGEAVDYIAGGSYRDFHLLHRSQKIQLADVAWRNEAKGTPPYWVARSILAKGAQPGSDEQKALQQQMDDDLVDVWAATLDATTLTPECKSAIRQGAVPDPTDTDKKLTGDQVQTRHSAATAILRKVFLILQTGVKVYDKKGNAEAFEGPAAKLLSHGGRVNIRVPKLTGNDTDDHKLTDWIGITKGGKRDEEGGVFKRSFGTHHMVVGDDEEDGTKGKFKEQGGAWAAFRSKTDSTELSGVNLAVGGLGSQDFNGDVVLPDGAHGHMFIGFLPPTAKHDGALQIGIETTGPHAPSTVGYVHDWRSSEKTANPISSSGGLKDDKVGHQRIVDLNDLGGDWLGELQAFEELMQGVSSAALVGKKDDLRALPYTPED